MNREQQIQAVLKVMAREGIESGRDPNGEYLLELTKLAMKNYPSKALTALCAYGELCQLLAFGYIEDHGWWAPAKNFKELFPELEVCLVIVPIKYCPRRFMSESEIAYSATYKLNQEVV